MDILDISEQERDAASGVHKNLLAAERLTNEREYEGAVRASNDAASGIRALDRIYKQRRGEPRIALAAKICYYRAWQQALVGVRCIRTGSSSLGIRPLQYALADATKLANEQAPTSELDFDELVRKIAGWLQTEE